MDSVPSPLKPVSERNMKKIIIIAFLIVAWFSCSSPAESKNDLVDQYMNVTNVDEIIKQYSYAYTAEAKRLYKNLPESFWSSKEYLKIIDEYENELWEDWKSVYNTKISENELKQLINFLKTDLGKKFLNIQKDTQPLFTKVALNAGGKLNDHFAELINNYKFR